MLIFRPTAFEPAEAPQDAATTAAEIIKTEIDAATSSIVKIQRLIVNGRDVDLSLLFRNS